MTAPLILSALDYSLLGRELPSFKSFLSMLGVFIFFSSFLLTANEWNRNAVFWLSLWYFGLVFESVYVKFFVSESKLSVSEQSYYQNLFSLPVLCIIAISTGELQNVSSFGFGKMIHVVSLLFSCVFGLGMSYLSFTLRGQISATSFTMVGNVCKLVSIALNSVVWNRHASDFGTMSVILCVCSSIFYEQPPLRNRSEISLERDSESQPQKGIALEEQPGDKLTSRRYIALSLLPVLFFGLFVVDHNSVIEVFSESTSSTLDDTSIDGVSGKLFSGAKIRDYHGANLEINTARQTFVEDDKFKCANWAVCTTIFDASDALHEVCQHLEDYCLVVVADTKTPTNFTVHGGCTFIHLSVKRQEKLQMYSTFASQIPWNHFGRKNLGYLYAIANGAKSIWDFDDDNKILSAEHFLDISDNDLSGLLTVDTNETSLNLYPLFGAETFSWPRGFPLENLKKTSQRPAKTQLVKTVLDRSEHIGVIQALANGDPDVDAIYRLQRKLPFSFSGARKSDIFVVPDQVFVPWNAQATIFSTRASLWAMYLPMSVHGRVSDIWRSYITQRLFQNICMRTAFAIDPLVVQDRNPHSYLADFDAEQDLYYKSGKLVELLSTWRPTTETLEAQVLELYVLLYERNYVGNRDVHMIRLWLDELTFNDYKFPTTCVKTAFLQDNLINLTHRAKGCVLDGNQYSCAPRLYASNEHYAALAKVNNGGSTELWSEWLNKHKQVRKGQNTVLKLVLMTKDEWPLIQTWVYYHGKMLGFDNLYIIDGSRETLCIEFLTYARDYLRVNIIFSAKDLNGVIKDINSVMAEISGASDLMMKVDTDEFLAILPDTESCYMDKNGTFHGLCQLTPLGVSAYLNDELAGNLDGSILKVGYQTLSIPDREVCDNVGSSNTLESGEGTTEQISRIYERLRFQTPDTTMIKAFFDSRTFKSVDLGSHAGTAWHPFDHGEHESLETRLGIIHLHYTCYDIEQRNNEKAVFSHQYLTPGSNTTERIQKLYDMFKQPPCDGTPKTCCEMIPPNLIQDFCPMNSCHKVLGYLRHLVCPADNEDQFYQTAGSQIGYQNRGFREYLEDSMLVSWQDYDQ